MKGGGLLRWHCEGTAWGHDARGAHWQQPCDGQRAHTPADALRYYRAGGPDCPLDRRHGAMILIEDVGAWKRVPVGGRGRP